MGKWCSEVVELRLQILWALTSLAKLSSLFLAFALRVVIDHLYGDFLWCQPQCSQLWPWWLQRLGWSLVPLLCRLSKCQLRYIISTYRDLTLRKEPCLAILYVLSEVPAISKIVVSFYELYSVSFTKAQLIRASSFEVICTNGC